MLGINNGTIRIVDALKLIPCLIELPDEWSDYFTRNGELDLRMTDVRRFPRTNLRGKAIMKRNGKHYTVLTKDISRAGLGFLHHEQLLPCEKIRLWMPNESSYELQVARCRRIARHCYLCGTKFLFTKS